MANIVEIVGDTGILRLHSPTFDLVQLLTFIAGSFNPSPGERRVITARFAREDLADYLLTLRFEFTDPLLATVDILGRPVYLTAEDRITPFAEPKGKTGATKVED